MTGTKDSSAGIAWRRAAAVALAAAALQLAGPGWARGPAGDVGGDAGGDAPAAVRAGVRPAAPPGGSAAVGEAARSWPVTSGHADGPSADAPGRLPPQVAAALAAAGLPASALAAVVVRLDAPAGGAPARPLPGAVPGALAPDTRAASAAAPAGPAAEPAPVSGSTGEAPLPGPALRLSLAAHEPRLAASLMKLVTTFAALDRLGADWRWHTPVWLAGPVRGGVLHGSLHLAAAGDPALSAERLWLLMQAVRAHGVREIRGDIVIDDSAYAAEPPGDPAAFDGEPLRPYNVLPRGLLVAQQSLLLQLRPDAAAGVAHVSTLPELAGITWPPAVPLDTAAACGDWRGAVRLDLADAARPLLRGRYPLACGVRDWPLAWPEGDPGEHARRAIEAAWHQAGGSLAGQVRAGPAPADVAPTLLFASPPLAEVVRSINKYSNNPMARLLFLTLGTPAAERSTPAAEPSAPAGPSNPAAGDRMAWRAPVGPATLERARRTVADWAVQRAGCRPGELVLDNGSGLSRQERASAACLAALLQAAWASPLMPELLASLPVAGLDGTARRLGGIEAAGRAHLKTGSLRDVMAVAGVVHGRSGARHAVVVLVNDARAAAARPVLDAVLAWAQEDMAP